VVERYGLDIEAVRHDGALFERGRDMRKDLVGEVGGDHDFEANVGAVEESVPSRTVSPVAVDSTGPSTRQVVKPVAPRCFRSAAR
jgi:hypothetical protein